MSSAMCIYRNIIYTNCRRLNISTFSKNTRAFAKFKDTEHNSVLPARTSSAICRRLSTQPNSDYNNKPAYTPLMEFPEVTWPGFFQMLKCWLTFKLGLPALDEDFDLFEFINGSQHVCKQLFFPSLKNFHDFPSTSCIRCVYSQDRVTLCVTRHSHKICK